MSLETPEAFLCSHAFALITTKKSRATCSPVLSLDTYGNKARLPSHNPIVKDKGRTYRQTSNKTSERTHARTRKKRHQ